MMISNDNAKRDNSNAGGIKTREIFRILVRKNDRKLIRLHLQEGS